MKDEIQTTLERHKRYDNIDGTGELFFGLMFLGFGLLGYLQTILPEHSMWRTNGFAALLFMYAVLIPALGLGFLVQRVIKKHITWPRTGYVARHSVWRAMFARRPVGAAAGAGVPGRSSTWIAMLSIVLTAVVVGAVFAGLTAGLMALARGHLDLLTLSRIIVLALMGAPYGFFIFFMGKEHRWKWVVFLLMALGLLVIGLIVPGDLPYEFARPAILFLGLVWMMSGMGTLISYLLHTHPPTAEAQ